MKISRNTLLPVFISIILFIIPFFWLKPGELDLGGDSSRLYFYDPVGYIFSSTLYGVAASGIGTENIYYLGIPFMLLLIALKYLLVSPTVLSSAFHGLNLSFAFFFVYLVIRELINEKRNNKTEAIISVSAIIGALFYAFSPALIDGWTYVLITRSQIFLNPLIFYLLLRYFKTSNFKYILVVLVVTFIFSPNFSIVAAPALFAFYPLSLLFLVIYAKLVLKKGIVIKELFLGVVLFFGLHAFHLIPQINNLISQGSIANATIFSESGKFERGLSYFSAIAPNIKASTNLLGFPQMVEVSNITSFFVLFPLVVVLAFILVRKKTLLLTCFFFLIVLFFATANVTNLGVLFYKSLFNIPGFVMFRNFYGQWQFVYIFFFCILFGQALYIVLKKKGKKARVILVAVLTFILVFNAFPFIKGDILRATLWQSNNVKSIIEMDTNYEKVLRFIRQLPSDGKILTLPLSDPAYQVIAGENGGAYMGPSTIAYLAGKKDFSGIEEFGPFREILLKSFEKKDYQTIQNIFSLLSIKYIFHNSDPRIYEKAFPAFPYIFVYGILPNNQELYKDFIEKLNYKKIYNDKHFSIYEVNDRAYLPHIYSPASVIPINLEIENWGYSLKEKDFVDGRPAIEINQSSNVYIKPIEKDVFRSVAKDFPISVYYPFARWKPGSFFYPFIVKRENYQLKSFENSRDAYIDRLLFLASKRISELERWRNDLSAFKPSEEFFTFDDPEIWEINRWGEYNSWNSSIARYYAKMTTAIETVDNSNQNEIWKDLQRIKISQNLRSHQIKTNIIINNSEAQNKSVIYDAFDFIFERLNERVAPLEYDPTRLEYLIPKVTEDTLYNFYVRNIQGEVTEVEINGRELNVFDPSSEDDWVRYENVELGEHEDRLDIQNNYRDLITDQKWRKVNSANILSEFEELEGEFITDTKQLGAVKHIPGLEPTINYLISFEYKTYGTDFEMSFYSKDTVTKNPQVKAKYTADFRETKNSRDWTSFAAVVQTRGTEDALFNINPADNTTDLQKIGVRNFSVYRLPSHPDVYLIQEPEEIKTETPPKIAFQRINPTKYKVRISEAYSPFTLILKEAFNSRWKLVDPSQDAESGQKPFYRTLGSLSSLFFGNLNIKRELPEEGTLEYFEGDIVENRSQNIFLNEKTFETWGKKEIAEDRHFTINGYANGWKLTPDDLNGQNEYRLILELDTQRQFYMALMISLFTLMLCSIFLGWSLLKHR